MTDAQAKTVTFRSETFRMAHAVSLDKNVQTLLKSKWTISGMYRTPWIDQPLPQWVPEQTDFIILVLFRKEEFYGSYGTSLSVAVPKV